MAKSSIDRLSAELKAKLHELLSRPNVTQQEVTEALNEAAGAPVVSKSAVNRYAVRMRKWADRNRQTREVVQAWLEQAGPDAQNQIGEVLIHQLRDVALDVMLTLQDLNPDSPEAIEKITKLISQLSRAVRDLETRPPPTLSGAGSCRKRSRPPPTWSAPHKAPAFPRRRWPHIRAMYPDAERTVR